MTQRRPTIPTSPCVETRRVAERALLHLAAAIAFLAIATGSGTAFADFRLCNNTGSRVGVSVGYKDGDTWTTEGWWNLSARSCETLMRGSLVARFYYVYAVDYDRGGDWSGKAYMCTRDKEFTIKGIEDCLARGFDRTGFFEVDTGEQRSWTVQLTDTSDPSSARTPGQAPPFTPGLPGAPLPAQPRGPAR